MRVGLASAQVRFALPSSLGPEVQVRARQLQQHLTAALGRETQVCVPATYEQLAQELLTGKVDVAWAPPFVCARIEAMGVRIVARGIRFGASTYRAALVTRADADITLETLNGTSAAWSDRDSIGGYLLAMAHLRNQGLNPASTFSQQVFAGNYRRALEAVCHHTADVTSVFAPAKSKASSAPEATGISELWPEQQHAFRVLGFTEESPNDGVAVSASASSAVVTLLEKTLLSLHQSDEGAAVLENCFHAERFELAPRMGYRSLYRVALASV